MTSSQSWSLRRITRLSRVSPALLTSMSMPPNAFSTSETERRNGRSVRSHRTQTPSRLGQSPATLSAFALSRPTTATRAPLSASALAMVRPIPRVLPVTSAVFPVRSMFTMRPVEGVFQFPKAFRTPFQPPTVRCASRGRSTRFPGPFRRTARLDTARPSS